MRASLPVASSKVKARTLVFFSGSLGFSASFSLFFSVSWSFSFSFSLSCSSTFSSSLAISAALTILPLTEMSLSLGTSISNWMAVSFLMNLIDLMGRCWAS